MRRNESVSIHHDSSIVVERHASCNLLFTERGKVTSTGGPTPQCISPESKGSDDHSQVSINGIVGDALPILDDEYGWFLSYFLSCNLVYVISVAPRTLR